MKNTEEQKLTTVKININLFQEFKYQCIKNKFSFQKRTLEKKYTN